MLEWLQNLLDPCKKNREENLDLKARIEFLGKTESERNKILISAVKERDQWLSDLTVKLQAFKKENADLKTALSLTEFPDASAKPDFLNEETPYVPKRFYNGETTQFPPTTYYSVADWIKKEVAIKRWATLPLDDRLLEIWGFVTEDFQYFYDKDENWQDALTTWFRKGGDCEDTTILFIVLCRAAGVPADSVFNACGQWGTLGGHSYPVAKMSDGKWYVFESTLNTPAPKSMLFAGSNYSAEWGFANWKFAGRLKDGRTQV